MISFPNCKINLGLNVIEKRTDGFHDIEGIFYPVPFCDALEIIEATNQEDVSIEVSGNVNAGEPEKNLCIKAYRLLKKDFDLPAVQMYLHKVIPTGAGLGGGSSDGAQTLLLLNQLFKLNLSTEALQNYASNLGSDCSFFIINQPAFCYGRGELQKTIELSLKGKYLVIIKPDIFVSTPEAYALIKPTKPKLSVQDIIHYPLEKWKDFLENDFEKALFKKHPAIANIKNTLYQKGALYASMSGSGSAVYGVFDKEVELKNVFEEGVCWGGNL